MITTKEHNTYGKTWNEDTNYIQTRGNLGIRDARAVLDGGYPRLR